MDVFFKILNNATYASKVGLQSTNANRFIKNFFGSKSACKAQIIKL